jgi:hypothetical protein
MEQAIVKRGGAPLMYEDREEEMNRRIDEYFELCEEKEDAPTWEGVAISLGPTKQTLSEWMHRNDHIGESTKRAKAYCEQWIAKKMIMGKIPPIGAIFTLKNNYGWKDQKDLDVTSKGQSIMGINYVSPTDAEVLDVASQTLLDAPDDE